MSELKIRHCPTCGSNRIKKVRRNWSSEVHGKPYTVPNLEFHECPDCGERLYSPEAMRKIESYSPAFAKRRRLKRSA